MFITDGGVVVVVVVVEVVVIDVEVVVVVFVDSVDAAAVVEVFSKICVAPLTAFWTEVSAALVVELSYTVFEISTTAALWVLVIDAFWLVTFALVL
jgi:hypothetical protein